MENTEITENARHTERTDDHLESQAPNTGNQDAQAAPSQNQGQGSSSSTIISSAVDSTSAESDEQTLGPDTNNYAALCNCSSIISNVIFPPNAITSNPGAYKCYFSLHVTDGTLTYFALLEAVQKLVGKYCEVREMAVDRRCCTPSQWAIEGLAYHGGVNGFQKLHSQWEFGAFLKPIRDGVSARELFTVMAVSPKI